MWLLPLCKTHHPDDSLVRQMSGTYLFFCHPSVGCARSASVFAVVYICRLTRSLAHRMKVTLLDLYPSFTCGTLPHIYGEKDFTAIFLPRQRAPRKILNYFHLQMIRTQGKLWRPIYAEFEYRTNRIEQFLTTLCFCHR